jgi:glycosyltransferase involved in cell wall biosynthesis
MQLDLISPYAHLNGHYWPYTSDFVQAMSAGGHRIRVFASRHPRYNPDSWRPRPEWNACCPWARVLVTDGYRARHWGGRADSLARNLEFLLCMGAAKRGQPRSGASRHIHCIESRHRILLKEVLGSSLSFSSLCVGEPPEGMACEREEAYRKAFATSRLTFIVETESVRKSWEHLAGDRVVHIPAALPAEKHRPASQYEARKQLGLPAESTIFLFFGTHREGKDYLTAIEAAKGSPSKPFLLFVGPLISGNDPAALIASMGYGNAACWNNYFADEKVPLLFDACDAVMLPYADNYQKGSAVLLQACHFGKPVIASASGHLREFVESNRTGLLYEPGSVSGLAKCYDMVSSWKAAGEAGAPWNFDLARSRYSWAALSESYLRIFAQSAG